MEEDLNTNITFALSSPTYVKIMRDDKEIGRIYSQKADGGLPYPHDKKKKYCQELIQICGFDKMDGPWSCGPYKNKRDVVLYFRPTKDEYFEDKLKEYERYVRSFFNAKVKKLKSGAGDFEVAEINTVKNVAELKSFQDWLDTGGAF